MAQVVAIYARENGQGMAFPMVVAEAAEAGSPAQGLQAVGAELKPVQLRRVESQASGDEPEPPRPVTPGTRPALKRVK